MYNYNNFRYICLVIVLHYSYSASIANTESLVRSEDLEKNISGISTLNPTSSIVNENDTLVDPTFSINVPELSDDKAEQFVNTDNVEDGISTSLGGIWNVNNKTVRYKREVSLNMPRCGVSDIVSLGADYKWEKRSLTYYVRNFPSGHVPDTVKQLLRKAFNEWSKVTALDFTESDLPQSDIEIVFGGQRHLSRGGFCSEPFKDVLGHASYPKNGVIHFNTKYFFGLANKTLFFHTALHEIGHAIGLEHSIDKTSIMYHTPVVIFKEIPQIDVEKIQSKYGKRQQVSFCDLPKYNAIFDGERSYVTATKYINLKYVIVGKYFYEPLKSFEPTLISERWPGAPDSIDAAFKGKIKIFMFNGAKVWAFKNGKLDAAYPREIRRVFPGLPKNLDAVMKYKELFLYAFKNGNFWRYNLKKKRVDHSGKVGDFGIPEDIDAANYKKKNNKAYFYKGKNTFVYNFANNQTKKYNNLWKNC